MKRNNVLTVLFLLIVCRGLSQTDTTKVCFDFGIAKKIAIDLNDLDGYRQTEPFQLAQIRDLNALNKVKDSIIFNLRTEADLQRNITRIADIKADIKKGESKWMKWLFLIGGLAGGYLLAK